MSITGHLLSKSSEKSSKLLVLIITQFPLSSKSHLISKIKSNVSDSFSLIGMYGDSKTCSEALGKYFNASPPEIPSTNSFLIVLDKETNSAALVYASEDFVTSIKNIFSFDHPDCFFIKILTSLCTNVIVCLSTSVIHCWYFSSEVKLSNPFNLKFYCVSQESKIFNYAKYLTFNLENQFKELNFIDFSSSHAYD